MSKYFFLIFTVIFLIFSFSTGLAHPIPDSSTLGRRNLMLMGRAVHYSGSERDVAMTPRNSDEVVTRAERFRRLLQRRNMQTPDGWNSSA